MIQLLQGNLLGVSHSQDSASCGGVYYRSRHSTAALVVVSSWLNFGCTSVRLFLFERLQTLLHICLKVLPQYTKEQDSAQFKHTWNFLIDVLASVRALHDRQFQSVSTLCALHPSNEQIIPEQTSCVYSDGLSNTQESLHTNSDPEPVASKYYDSFLFNARQMALLRAANLHDSGLAAIQHQTQLAISRVIDKNSLDAQLCRSKQETMEYATRLQKSEEDLRAITEQAAELQLHLDCLRR